MLIIDVLEFFSLIFSCIISTILFIFFLSVLILFTILEIILEQITNFQFNWLITV